MAYIYNPHYGYFDDRDEIYFNRWHVANNAIMCAAEFVVYSLMLTLYYRAVEQSGDLPKNGQIIRREKAVSSARAQIRAEALMLADLFSSLSYWRHEFCDQFDLDHNPTRTHKLFCESRRLLALFRVAIAAAAYLRRNQLDDSRSPWPKSIARPRRVVVNDRRSNSAFAQLDGRRRRREEASDTSAARSCRQRRQTRAACRPSNDQQAAVKRGGYSRAHFRRSLDGGDTICSDNAVRSRQLQSRAASG